MSTVACVVKMQDVQCDKLATVVGRQFITLSVQLCVQHDERNAVRRANLSAEDETCSAMNADKSCNLLVVMLQHNNQ